MIVKAGLVTGNRLGLETEKGLRSERREERRNKVQRRRDERVEMEGEAEAARTRRIASYVERFLRPSWCAM